MSLEGSEELWLGMDVIDLLVQRVLCLAGLVQVKWASVVRGVLESVVGRL